MAVASSDQPGTDFTVLTCAQLTIYLIGSLVSGRLADAFGYGALLRLAAALSGIAVIATLLLLKRTTSPLRLGAVPNAA